MLFNPAHKHAVQLFNFVLNKTSKKLRWTKSSHRLWLLTEYDLLTSAYIESPEAVIWFISQCVKWRSNDDPNTYNTAKNINYVQEKTIIQTAVWGYGHLWNIQNENWPTIKNILDKWIYQSNPKAIIDDLSYMRCFLPWLSPIQKTSLTHLLGSDTQTNKLKTTDLIDKLVAKANYLREKELRSWLKPVEIVPTGQWSDVHTRMATATLTLGMIPLAFKIQMDDLVKPQDIIPPQRTGNNPHNTDVLIAWFLYYAQIRTAKEPTTSKAIINSWFQSITRLKLPIEDKTSWWFWMGIMHPPKYKTMTEWIPAINKFKEDKIHKGMFMNNLNYRNNIRCNYLPYGQPVHQSVQDMLASSHPALHKECSRWYDIATAVAGESLSDEDLLSTMHTAYQNQNIDNTFDFY